MTKEDYINKKFEHDRSDFNKSISLNSRAYCIADSIAVGMSYRLIVAKFMKDWGVSYNYMHSIITEAINMFLNEEIYRNLKAINNERLNELYLIALLTGKVDDARKVIDTMNKLNGLYDDAPKTTINVNTNEPVTVTFGGDSLDDTLNINDTETANIIETILNKNDD